MHTRCAKKDARAAHQLHLKYGARDDPAKITNSKIDFSSRARLLRRARIFLARVPSTEHLPRRNHSGRSVRRLNKGVDEDLAMTGSIFDFMSRGPVASSATAKSDVNAFSAAHVRAAGTCLRCGFCVSPTTSSSIAQQACGGQWRTRRTRAATTSIGGIEIGGGDSCTACGGVLIDV